MKKSTGFALFDVLLAVILIAIASYATFKIAKSFQSSESVQQVEQLATNIAQNYVPYLPDGSNTLITNNQLLTEYLQSITVPAEYIVSPSATSSYVFTGVFIGGVQSQMNFEAVHDSSGHLGANYLVMGLSASANQANQIAQDLGGTFSVFYAASGSSISGAKTGLIDTSSSASATYAVYLVFPKAGTSVPAGATLTAL